MLTSDARRAVRTGCLHRRHTIGLIAGYYRGFWDMLLMRCVDVQLALPFILIALTFITILGGGLTNIILFMIISQWVQFARLVRGMVLSVREREFVLAARSFGVRDLSMLHHHILNQTLQTLHADTIADPNATTDSAPCLPDANFEALRPDQQHSRSLWVSKPFDQARSELFLSALRLHEATVPPVPI